MRNSKNRDKLLLIFSIIVAICVAVAFALAERQPDRPAGTEPDDTDSAVFSDITSDITDEITTAKVTDAPVTTEEPVTEPPATEPPTTEPPPPVEKVISVLACGDNLLYRPNTFEADERATDGKRSYTFTYENVRELLSSADISFINQETLLCGGNTGYPLFNSPFEVADTLAELGFDVANIATNHMLDVGYDYGVYSTGEGIAVSRKTLEDKGILAIGGYDSEDDFKSIRIIEREGVRIAFLAFTDSTNTIKLSPDSDIYIPYLTEENVRTAVSLAKEMADVVIVSAHWGVDSSRNVTDEQRTFAKLFADLGVDAVIGHHSHIVHPIEWIEGKDGNKMLCAYSLGNFIGIMEYPLTVLGGILTFDIHTLEGSEPWIENVGFVPTVYHYNRYYRNNVIYYLEDYTNDLADEHGVYLCYYNRFTVEELSEYLEDTVGKEFLRSKNDYR